MTYSLPPWHLWGTTKTLEILQANPIAVASGTDQLARIDYGRPETWSFMFSATLMEANISGVGGATLDIYFPILLGLARSQVSFQQFEHYSFNVNTDVGVTRYSTEVVGPDRLYNEDTELRRENLIRLVTAQSINCGVSYRMGVTGSVFNVSAKVSVSAFFAPNMHIRPEWFQRRFPGGETEGH